VTQVALGMRSDACGTGEKIFFFAASGFEFDFCANLSSRTRSVKPGRLPHKTYRVKIPPFQSGYIKTGPKERGMRLPNVQGQIEKPCELRFSSGMLLYSERRNDSLQELHRCQNQGAFMIAQSARQGHELMNQKKNKPGWHPGCDEALLVKRGSFRSRY
jgi:hypothetical protein